MLTLNFNNGERSTNSCFTSDAVSSIVLNGTTYYAEEKNASNTKNNAGAASRTPPAAADLKTGQAFLKKANLANGGKDLDEVRSARLKYSMGNGAIQITTLLDLTQSAIRMEYRKNGQLLGIEQTDANAGWEFSKGKSVALSSQRIREMQDAFFHGVFNLQSAALEKVKLLNAPQVSNGETTLVVSAADGTVMGWMFDKDNRLAGKGSKINGKPVTHFFSDFRTIKNIVLPFSVKELRDNKTFTYAFTSFEINPTLNSDDWSKP